MKKYSVSELIDGIKQRDFRTLGKAITIVENGYDGKNDLLEYAYDHADDSCLVIGLTGAGGAGKSTITDKLIKKYKSLGKSVGVMAIDPSSPYTGGAVLGDRVRMTSFRPDKDTFIRSFGSRGSLGGISRGAKEVLYLYKAYRFDVIIIESVGVGQAETEITDFVDVTVVVLAPGNGDDIQLAKAGTQEIADVFVVNKADRADAETLRLQLLTSLDCMDESKRPFVIKTVASQDKEIDELCRTIDQAYDKFSGNRKFKRVSRIKNELYMCAMRSIERDLRGSIDRLTNSILSGKLTPVGAANVLDSMLHSPEPCVSVIIVSNKDEVLLGKRGNSSIKPGKWCLPCGHIDKHESIYTAARREVREETNLEILPLTIVNVISNGFTDGRNSIVAVLTAEALSDDLQAGDDLVEVGWFPLKGPLPDMAFKADQHVINQYIKERGMEGIRFSETSLFGEDIK